MWEGDGCSFMSVSYTFVFLGSDTGICMHVVILIAHVEWDVCYQYHEFLTWMGDLDVLWWWVIRIGCHVLAHYLGSDRHILKY